MNSAVPSSRDQRKIINEFDSKNSVIMANAIPLGRLELSGDGFGFWIKFILHSS
jgi:hypothetical protein